MNSIKSGLGWLLLPLILWLLGRRKVKPGEKITTDKELYPFLREKLGPNCRLKLVDARFYLPVDQEVLDFLRADQTDKKKHIDDFFDCDNRSQVLAARASLLTKFRLAVVDSKVHSYNLIVTKSWEVFIIEPKTDDKMSIGEAKRKGKTYAHDDLRWG